MNGKFKIVIMAIACLFVSKGYTAKVYAADVMTSYDAQDILAMPNQAYDMTAEPETPAYLTYIDISIDNQMLVYYVNGSPVLITPCVTGSPGRSTPKGVWQINSCIPGKRLKGATWNVWVDRWMRFCGNCGIHDAKWRKSFGGEIYKTNGSHGCVNIPHDQAVLLYSMVGVGTTVIVH
jgi:lipoprotein-anchoring transpeptidase ErfK/SrfK